MMMKSDLVKMSLHNLRLHKVRSLLTSLGIIFGIGSVISMLAISEGARRESLEQIASMGIENILVSSQDPGKTDQSSASSQGSVTRYGITERDRRQIAGMDNIGHITPLRNTRERIQHGAGSLDLRLIATDPSFLQATTSRMKSGRWLTAADLENRMTVCVIGRNVKRKYFSLNAATVLGRVIRVRGELFRVVGIMENPNESELLDMGNINDMILIPDSTATALYRNRSVERAQNRFSITELDYDALIVRVEELEHISHTARRIEQYLHKVHRDKDWRVFVPLDLFKQQEQTQSIFTIVMGSIAGISLIVGGIGIMNIMLANVYERRKEIGTRRALGARRRDILNQFLMETVVLTAMGGVFGVLLGVLLSQTVALYARWPVVYTWWSILFALVISCVTGIAFGTYPAVKAARQNVIEILRAE
jgi:putative ABC transport system permease protein